MIRRIVVSVSLAAFTLVAVIVPSQVAHAQSQTNTPQGAVNSGNGMRVAPVRSDLTIKPGTSQTVDVYVQNITSAPAQLKGVINDFVASDDESGKPRVLLDGNDAPSHGLRRYVDKINDFTLQPQEQKIIKVKVSMPADAAGGGYYGAVRFLPTSANNSKNVSLSASVGSLILVTVPGDVKEQMNVEGFNVVKGDSQKASSLFTNGSDLKAVFRVKNSGNTQEAPFGKMNLKKSGKIVSTIELNNEEPRASVLPDSIRRFTTPISSKEKPLGFGKYTVEGNFGYGANGQLLSVKTSFYVIPMAMLITGIVVILLIIAAAVIFPRMLKSHDRKLLRKIRSGRRK